MKHEWTAILQRLEYEHALFDKYRTWSRSCSDTEFAARCGQIAEKHRENYNRLAQYLR